MYSAHVMRPWDYLKSVSNVFKILPGTLLHGLYTFGRFTGNPVCKFRSLIEIQNPEQEDWFFNLGCCSIKLPIRFRRCKIAFTQLMCVYELHPIPFLGCTKLRTFFCDPYSLFLQTWGIADWLFFHQVMLSASLFSDNITSDSSFLRGDIFIGEKFLLAVGVDPKCTSL